MQIDWITVSAQIVNFLILVWLLKRFLYGPVVAAMDRREQRITGRLEDARRREQEAEAQAREHRERREALEREREQRLREAEEQAAQRRRELMDEAREAVERQREQWRSDLEQEREDLAADLRRRLARIAVQVASRVLADLAGADLEARMVERLARRLEDLDDEGRRALADGDEPLRVTSAFELDGDARQRLARTLRERLGDDRDPVFEVSEELVCGIELTRGGRRIGWAVADYLEDIEQQLPEALSAPKEQAA